MSARLMINIKYDDKKSVIVYKSEMNTILKNQLIN